MYVETHISGKDCFYSFWKNLEKFLRTLNSERRKIVMGMIVDNKNQAYD